MSKKQPKWQKEWEELKTYAIDTPQLDRQKIHEKPRHAIMTIPKTCDLCGKRKPEFCVVDFELQARGEVYEKWFCKRCIDGWVG
ncbi:MAG: hypothetical protein JRE40_07660 [Deltaproteobacteria bacterium]|nr:hypothetical protein [Deltaproteobacteria bacterium]MBW2674020.1 hypothetical protein [Deltaproteobacteria bacterium]